MSIKRNSSSLLYLLDENEYKKIPALVKAVEIAIREKCIVDCVLSN